MSSIVGRFEAYCHDSHGCIFSKMSTPLFWTASLRSPMSWSPRLSKAIVSTSEYSVFYAVSISTNASCNSCFALSVGQLGEWELLSSKDCMSLVPLHLLPKDAQSKTVSWE